MKKSIKYILFTITLITFLFFVVSCFKPFKNPMQKGVTEYRDTIGQINKNTIVEQKFISLLDDLDSISIRYANYGQEIENGKLIAKILDSEENIIYLNDFELSKIKDNQMINLEFNVQKNVKNNEFTLVLETKGMNKDNFISFYSEEDKIELTSHDGINASGTIAINQKGESSSYFYTFVTFIIFIIEIFVIFFMKYKDNENVIKHNKINNIFILLLSFILSICLIDCFIDIYYENRLSYISFPAFVIATILIIRNIAINCSPKNFKLENLFLSLAIPLGALYMVCVLPTQVPDEVYHYNMVNQLSDGNILLKNYDNIKLKKEVNNYLLVKDNLFEETDEIFFVKNITNGGYSQFLYIFAAFGLLIGKLFGLTTIASIYLARFMNYLVFITSGYYIIKMLPFAKIAAIVYLLSPMSLQQGASLSCDAIINASCLLYITYILHLKFEKEKIEMKDSIIISVLLLFVLVSKFAYFPLALLLFLLKDKIKLINKEEKKKLFIPIMIMILIFLVSFIYLKYIVTTFNTNSVSAVKKIMIPDKPYTKIEYLLLNPFKIIYIFLNTLYLYFDFYILTFVGSNLGLLSIFVPTYLIIFYLIVLVVSFMFDDNEKISFKKYEKFLIYFVWIMNFGVILAGLYLGWGNIRDPYIEGVQGRYFIPINFLLFLPFINKFKATIKQKNMFITIPLLIINIYAISSVIKYFLR